jgi:uncharacterized protein YegJ (DUF2314 family)
MRARTGLLVLMLAGVASACGAKPEVLTDPNDPTNLVTIFKDDDPKMNAAFAKARATVGQMIEALKSPQGKSEFAVKMRFRDEDDEDFGEQMWVQPVRFVDGKFTGRLSNEPEFVTSVKSGQVVSAPRDEILDWMYVENGKLVGGYTVRVQRDSLGPKERAEFDDNVGFRIE